MQSGIRKPTPVDLSLVFLLALVWASAFLVIKLVVVDTGPLWLATIRVIVGFLVLLPFALYKGVVWPKTHREWKLVLLVMALNVIAPFFLISWAETKIDAGMTSMLMGVGPFLAILGSHFTTDDDRLSKNKLIGAIFGFSGILILVGWDAARGLGDNLLGQGAAILGSAGYVTSGLIIRRLGKGFPPIQLSALILGLATISLLFITIVLKGLPPVNYSSNTWMGLLYLGIFPTALGYILRYHLIQTIGMTAFSTGLNLIPVFGVILGFLFLGEELSLNLIASLMLIVTGLFIIRRG